MRETDGGLEVMQQCRESQTRANLEAEDLMAASLLAPVINSAGSSARQENIELERVRAGGAVSTHLQKLVTLKSEVEEKFTDCSSLLSGLEGEAEEALSSLAASLKKKRDEAIQQILVAKSSIEVARADISGLGGQELKDLKNKMISTMQQASKGTVKEFNEKIKSSKAWVEKRKREHAASQAAGSAATEESPLVKKFSELATAYAGDVIPAAVIGSIFEAKAGIKPAKVTPKANSGDPVQMLSNLPAVKAARKSLKLHLHSNPWGLFPFLDESKVKKIDKILAKGYDGMLLSCLPLPNHLDWTQKVFAREAFGMSSNFLNIGINHSCLMECRLLLSGSETLFGFTYAEIPGASAKEKRSWLYSASAIDLLPVLQAGGFIATHDQTEVLVVPSGFIVVCMSTVGATGIR